MENLNVCFIFWPYKSCLLGTTTLSIMAFWIIGLSEARQTAGLFIFLNCAECTRKGGTFHSLLPGLWSESVSYGTRTSCFSSRNKFWNKRNVSFQIFFAIIRPRKFAKLLMLILQSYCHRRYKGWCYIDCKNVTLRTLMISSTMIFKPAYSNWHLAARKSPLTFMTLLTFVKTYSRVLSGLLTEICFI